MLMLNSRLAFHNQIEAEASCKDHAMDLSNTRDPMSSPTLTDSNHGGLVRVVGGFCTACTLLFLCTRLLIRWPWKTLSGRDDVVVTFATVSGASYSNTQFVSTLT